MAEHSVATLGSTNGEKKQPDRQSSTRAFLLNGWGSARSGEPGARVSPRTVDECSPSPCREGKPPGEESASGIAVKGARGILRKQAQHTVSVLRGCPSTGCPRTLASQEARASRGLRPGYIPRASEEPSILDSDARGRVGDERVEEEDNVAACW
eukprot:scaffold24871_cov31-Tisochrysis_lutea.AAC.1